MSAGPGVRVLRSSSLRPLFRNFPGPVLVDLPHYSTSRRINVVQPNKNRIQERRYASTHSERQNDTLNQDSSSHDPDAALDRELLAIQDAAIAQLEERLGMSLQQAIEEDKLASHMEDTYLEARDAQDEEGLNQVEESSIDHLRQDGASMENIAREARNIFGDVLPDDVLTDEERKVYVRHYGEPLDEVGEEELARLAAQDGVQELENELYDIQGEPIQYRLEDEAEIQSDMERQKQNTHTISVNAQPNPDEVAALIDGQVVDEIDHDDLDDDLEDDGEDSIDTRTHPLTRIGRFGTYPRTVFMPRASFLDPVESILRDFSNKQLKEMSERTFGGPGLPDSPLTPRSGRSRPQIPVPLDVSQQVMGQMEANAFMAVVMPPLHASIMSTLTETRKRLGTTWLNNLLARPGGPRILDVGSGGAGIVAWREIVQAHWDSLHSSDGKKTQPPPSKTVVLTASNTLRHRAAAMLENTTFIPRLPDYVNTRGMPTLEDDRPAQQRKQFDVIIASHSLFTLKEEWERKQHVQNLWSLLSNEGGVLIIIEKGIPRGFETVAAARHLLLERYIATPPGQETYYTENEELDAQPAERSRQTGMIIAPCTNHDRCPLYKTTGLSRGRKDICGFQQRFIRPAFLQRILGAKDRNHDDVDFSYLSVMKGEDLRTRSFETVEHIDDPLSAPQHQDLPSLAQQTKAISDSIKAGFEDTMVSHSSSVEDYDADLDDVDEFISSKKFVPLTRTNFKMTSIVPPPTHLLPRQIMSPLKRRGHVTIDVCTPNATLERWTVPKSFSRQAYRDARKSRWGDLWALGAKTAIPRNIKVGVSQGDLDKAGGKTKRASIGKKAKLERQRERQLEFRDQMREEEEAEHEEWSSMLNDDNLQRNKREEDDDLIDMDTLLPKKKEQPSSLTRTQASRVQDQESQAQPSATTQPKKRPSEVATVNKTTSQSQLPPANAKAPASDDRAPGFGEIDPLVQWSEDFRREVRNDMLAGRAGSGKRGGAFGVTANRTSSKEAKRLQKMGSRALR